MEFDAAWLKSCIREAHSRYQDLKFCKLKEPGSNRTWEAASVPRESAAAKSRLEADFQFSVERLADWQDPPVSLIQTTDEIVLIYTYASAAHLFDRPGGQPLDTFLALLFPLPRLSVRLTLRDMYIARSVLRTWHLIVPATFG